MGWGVGKSWRGDAGWGSTRRHGFSSDALPSSALSPRAGSGPLRTVVHFFSNPRRPFITFYPFSLSKLAKTTNLSLKKKKKKTLLTHPKSTSSLRATPQLNEASTVYYYVVSGASPIVPTPAQVKAQYDSYVGQAVKSKGTTSAAADTEVALTLTGDENEVLSVFVVAEDTATPGNLQSSVTTVPLVMGDDSPPVFAPGYPAADEIDAHSFELLVRLDEAGTIHYAVLPQSSDAPTVEQLVAGTHPDAVACSPSTGVYVPKAPYSVSASGSVFHVRHNVTSAGDPVSCGDESFYGVAVTDGLAGGVLEPKCRRCPQLMNQTTYDLYVLAEDDNGQTAYFRTNNVQTAPKMITVSMADITPPLYFPEGDYPLFRNLGTFAVDLAVSLSEPGTAFYLVVSDTSAPPTSEQVKGLVTSYGGVNVIKSGTWAVPTSQTDYGISVTGLDDEFAHSAYVVVQDDGNANTTTNMYRSNAPNLQLVPNRLDFTTLDGTPPSWSGAYTPTLSAIAGTSFQLDAQLNEPGNVYYVVVPRTSDAPPTVEPTSAQVFAGAFAGTVACGAFEVPVLGANFSKAIATTLEPEKEPACSALNDFYGLSVAGISGSGFCSACPIIESQSRYWVYVVADDTDGNVQTTPRRLAVETTDITPPTFEGGTPEIVGNALTVHGFQPNNGGVTLSVTTELDEPGRAYYLVALATAAPPTAQQVRSCGATRDGNMRSTAGFTYVPSDGAAAVAPYVCGVKPIPSAHTLYTMELQAVPAETTVRVYVVADDYEDKRPSFPGLLLRPPVANLQLEPVYLEAETVDISAPVFVEVAKVAYPSIPHDVPADGSGITGDQVTLAVAMNEAGVVYYVVVPKGFTYNKAFTDGSARSVPTVAEVKAGTGPGGQGQVTHGAFAVAAADAVTTHVTAAGQLTSETAYDVYLVAEDDAAGARNVQDKVTFLEFKTRDVTPPAWTANYPAALRGGRAVQVAANMNEPGQAFFVIVAGGSAPPNSSQVVAGAYAGVTVLGKCGQQPGTFDMPVAGEDYSCSVAGLQESTTYDVYVVARDNEDNALLGGQARVGSPNVQLTPVKLQVTTADITAPAHQLDTPRVERVFGDYFDLVVKLDEPGVAFYTVDAYNAPAPSAENVRMGLDHDRSFVFASGNISVPAAFTDTLGFVGEQRLVSERDYWVYVTAEDLEQPPNLQQKLKKIHVRTPDVTPPKFVGRWTENGTVTAVTGYGFDLVVALNEVGTTYYVVLPAGSAAPTADDVKHLRAGAEGSGAGAPVACGAWQQTAGYVNVTQRVEGVNVTDRPDCFADDGFYGLAAGEESFYGLDGAAAPPFCSRCPKLSSETAYDVWIVAEDDGGHGVPAEEARDKKNLMARAERVLVLNYPETAPSVITADVTPPEWVDKTPYPTDFFGTGFDLVVALDEPGAAWYAVTMNGVCDDFPTQAQIRAGTDGCGNAARARGNITVPAANVKVQHTVSGLGTDSRGMDLYIVWMYAEDDEPTRMSSLTLPNRAPVLDGFVATTTDVMNPLYNDGYPTVGNPVSRTGYGELKTTFDVTVALDEPGTAHYVAFPAYHALPENKGSGLPGSRVPTTAQIKAGQDYKGNTAAVRGSWRVSAADTPYTITTTHALSDSTLYNVYVAVEDDAGDDGRPHKYKYDNNLVGRERALQVTTADGSAPLFTGNPCNSSLDEVCPSALHSYAYEHSIFPQMSDCRVGEFTLTVNVNEDGSTVHYMVVGYDPTNVDDVVDPTNEEVAGQAMYTPRTRSGNGSIPAPSQLDIGAIDAPVSGTTYSKRVKFTHSAASYYQVFVTTEGPSGNLGDGDVKRTTNVNPTKMAPCLVTHNFVNVSWDVKDTELVAKVYLTAPATVYYVLLRGGSPAPNPTQILNGQDSANATSVCYDHVDPFNFRNDVRCYFADTSQTNTSGSKVCDPASGTLWSGSSFCQVATFTNLSRAETYDLYTVVTHVNRSASAGTDAAGRDGTTVFYAEFTRVPERNAVRTYDRMAPFFKPGYPRVTDVRGDGFMLAVQLDEPGAVYFVVVEGGSTSPTPKQIMDAQVSSSKLIAKGSLSMPEVINPADRYEPYNITVAGLHPKSTYDLYVVAIDDEAEPFGNNLQAKATQLTFKAASTDAHLAGLLAHTEDGTNTRAQLKVQPALKQNVYFYQAFVGVTTSVVLVTLVANDTESARRIYVNGTLRPSGEEFAVNVPHGKTVFEINVTAGDTVTRKTYLFAVTRARDDTVSNATLSVLDITFDDGTRVNSTLMGGRAWPRCVKGCDAHAPARCSPANPECVMDSQLTEYVLRVPASVHSINVTALASQNQSHIQLFTLGTAGVNYPGGLPGYTTGKPLQGNPMISLYSLAANGGNTIDLVVTAGDGTTKKTYTISVARFGPGVYGEGWKPVVPTTAMVGDRYGQLYGADDPLTTRVGIDPTVRDLTVIPALDIAPPRWIGSYPRTVNTTTSSVELVVQLDEPGVVYYLIVADTARVPTSREVKEGPALRPDVVSYGNITSLRALTQEVAVMVPGLTAATSYAVWFVAEDKAIDLMLQLKPNLQSAPVRSDITTK